MGIARFRIDRGERWRWVGARGLLHVIGFADTTVGEARIPVAEITAIGEDVSTGEATPLTSSGSLTSINGTSDWVYEEEFGVRDGFRWSECPAPSTPIPA